MQKLITIKNKTQSLSKNAKENIKMALGLALACIPMYKVATYMWQVHTYRKAFSEGAILNKKIEEAMQFCPTNSEEYFEVCNSGNGSMGSWRYKFLETFNNCLAKVKTRGTLSDEFLTSHGFATGQEGVNEYNAKLDYYYALGCDGDTVAQQQFMLLKNAGDQDIYFQASQEFQADLLVNLSPGDVEMPTIFETMDAIGTEESLIAIACVDIAVLIIACTYKINMVKKFRENRARKKMIKEYSR